MKTVKKTHWLRTTIVVMLICGLAGTILAGVLFTINPDRTNVSASLQFSFDGAAEGLAPNDELYNIINSDQVMEDALKAAHFDDVYTIDQIRNNMVVTGIYPEDLIKQMTKYTSALDAQGNQEVRTEEFHPTLYTVTLYNDFDKTISREKLETLLKSLMETYKEHFINMYSVNLDWMDDEVFSLEQYDYAQKMLVIEETIRQQERYAEEMYEKNPTFMFNGKSFKDAAAMFAKLRNSDIPRLNAIVMMDALSRNRQRLITQYRYGIKDLTYELEEQSKQLEEINQLVDSYEKSEIIYLSTADSVNKIDGNSSGTYDTLVRRQKAVSERITVLRAKIVDYEKKLKVLTDVIDSVIGMTDSDVDSQNDEEVVSRAEDILVMSENELAEAEEVLKRQTEELDRRMDALVVRQKKVTESFIEYLKAFNDEELNERSIRIFDFKYFTPKFLSVQFIKEIIKDAGPVCAVGFMICMILLIISRRREEKRAAQSR